MASLPSSLQADSELCRIFKQFVEVFRADLCPAQTNDYLFVVSNLLEQMYSQWKPELAQVRSWKKKTHSGSID